MTSVRRLIGFALGSFAFLIVLSGCQQASGAPPATPPAGAVTVSAGELTFDQATVDVPAGEAFTLWFENRVAVPHNVHVVTTAGDSISRGEVFTGPAAQPLEVPELAPGTYRLLCDVHPDMTAEMVAADR